MVARVVAERSPTEPFGAAAVTRLGRNPEITRFKGLGEISPEEFEMYNLSSDPMELNNLAGNPSHWHTQQELAQLLDEQRSSKRLTPVSGEVPGQP